MKLLKFLTGSATLAGLLIGTGGCELIANPDRSKIEPTGGGGTGGVECTPVDDKKECTDDVCENGAPVSKPKAAGEACTENGGAVCNDAGECVVCLDDTQCTSPQYCNGRNQCVDPTCNDGLVNGNETDEDCGGADCSPCVDGKVCAIGTDCDSGVCADDGSGALTCAVPACGDGVVNGMEACDDGNLENGDGCDSNCKPTGCGNGVVGPNEECDDENDVNGDGCDNNCTVTACGNGIPTAGEACDDGNLTDGDGCDSNCTDTACGNGVPTAGEDCDDGNTDNGDGCDNNCTVTACGNGVTTMGELCDDGNLDDGDGCDSNCTTTECGNGVATAGEDCDDGNADNGDGCDNNCTVTACGNGVVTGTEACDDGNTIDGDGCDNNCTVTACGNGIVTAGEDCDDGNTTNGDGCDNNCTVTACGNGIVTGTEACDDGNTIDGDGCNSNCTVPGCGNGIPDAGEACDDGNTTNGDGCDNNCTMTACGNGIVTAGEVCDDGNTTNGDGCDNNCTVTACGNGIQAGAEACDDGNTTNGDGCDNNCTVTACGNGVVTAGEACDDGNTTDGDCCSAACQLENCEIEPNNSCGAVNPMPAFSGAPLASTVKGAITPANDQDFYSFTIGGTQPVSVRLETYFGTPGTCTSTSINDTTVELRGTTCTTVLATDLDDGPGWCSLIDAAPPTNDTAAKNLMPGTYHAVVRHNGTTGTTSQYTFVVTVVSTCGDGVVNSAYEACDDGDNDAGDGCSPTCTVEAGFFCQGTAPSVCAAPEVNCNDGVDNNGAFGADALDPSCQLPAYFSGCGAGQQLFVVPNNASIAIPDNTPAGITSNVTVSNAGTIARVAVLYNITHAYVSDVDISLVTPVPSTIDICSDNGGSGDNFVNTLLDPTCSTNVTSGTAPFTGCYIPESAAQVTALGGLSANGTWGLRVVDDESPDPGVLNNWTLILCTTVCGDGQQGGAEQCDDGNMTDGDGCDNNCKITACGNGVVTAGEACDDGNTVNGDGCDNDCSLSACGNGIQGGAEQCDDGNMTDGDGCSSCAVDPGYTCTGGAPSMCTFTCSDGALTGNEQCDDGNMTDDDGCSSTCQLEAGFQCTTTPPSMCTAQEVVCNDGVDNDGDGDTDGADADCAVPAYFPACGAGETLRIYRSVNVPKAIPDNDLAGITSVTNVFDSGTIQRLAVLFDITHDWDSDVDMYLTPPGGAALDICTDNGGSGFDFTATVLDTTCATNITAGTAPFSGCYKPETSFATFTGSTAGNGLWTLRVADDATGDTGTLNSWAILLCTTP